MAKLYFHDNNKVSIRHNTLVYDAIQELVKTVKDGKGELISVGYDDYGFVFRDGKLITDIPDVIQCYYVLDITKSGNNFYVIRTTRYDGSIPG